VREPAKYELEREKMILLHIYREFLTLFVLLTIAFIVLKVGKVGKPSDFVPLASFVFASYPIVWLLYDGRFLEHPNIWTFTGFLNTRGIIVSALIAVVIGHVSLRKAKKNNSHDNSGVVAKLGIGFGYLWIFSFLGFWGFYAVSMTGFK